MENLANKYRPKLFSDVLAQSSIIKILQRQLEIREFPNAMLLAGPTGCGKTTLARIYASEVNKGVGNPIEIDGASNNGVDNVRMIIEDAKERALDSEYKIYIIDECHSITPQGWQAFLKCLEETPKYTIFIFCTTDPNKIPTTIQNRLMRFNLTKISTEDIVNRLNYICKNEGFTNYNESNELIARISKGGMRDALTYLTKVATLSPDFNIDNTLNILGHFSYNCYFDLTNALIDRNPNIIIDIIDTLFSKGDDLKLFLDFYLDFILDVEKYCIFKTLNSTTIPQSMLENLNYLTNIDNNIHYFNWLLEKLFDIKQLIKYDNNIKTTLTIKLLQIIRG